LKRSARIEGRLKSVEGVSNAPAHGENVCRKKNNNGLRVKNATRKESGAHARPGKDVVQGNESRTAVSPVHNGKAIPTPTKSKDLFGEVCDLSPSSKKKSNLKNEDASDNPGRFSIPSIKDALM